jgi:hypothetical protein
MAPKLLIMCISLSHSVQRCALSWYQKQFHSLLLWSFHVLVIHGSIAYQNWNLSIPFVTVFVSCLSAQNMFMNTHFMSWPWDTRSLWRSIFLELFPLSFSMKGLKFHDDVDKPLQERRSTRVCEDRWRLVLPFTLSLPRNLGVEILVRWVEL